MNKISQNRQKKIDNVAALKDKLAKTKALFLTDYRGMTHTQMETLRKALKKVQAEFVVAKNTLLKIAMKQCNNLPTQAGDIMLQLEKELKNPTATLLAFGDEMAAIKELAFFIKNTQLPKIKLGFFAGKLATEADFTKLSALPSREILLATLVARLQSPISGLHYALSWNMRQLVTVLSNVKGKKLAI